MHTLPMSKRFILFDHDGVLVEPAPWYYEATRLAVASLGVELDLPSYLQDMATGGTAWEQARSKGASDAEVVRQRDYRNQLYQEFLRTRDIEIQHVGETLDALSRNYQMAIVTTARKPDFVLIHEDRDIVRHMDFVLANGDYARAKPAPDPYLTALERFGADKGAAIVVEDSERGLRAAVAAGIDCVVVANSFTKGQDLSAATWHIDALTELPALLTSL